MTSERDVTPATSFLEALASGALFLAALAALTACGDLAPSDNGDAGGPPTDLGDVDLGGGFVSEHVRFTEATATSGTLGVDASDAEAWVYVDLDARREVRPTDPADDAVWDVAFRRFHVALNGGVSGTSGVRAALVTGVAFDAVTLPADAAFHTDAEDGEDDDTVTDYVVSGGLDPWYDYDVVTHVLTPKTRVYVVRTSAGAAVQLALQSYYDGAGGSGHPTLRYALIAE